MKKIFVILSGLLAFTFSKGNAQNFHFGAMAGLNLSTQITDVKSQNLKHPLFPGFNAGISVEYMFSYSDMSIAAEVQYSMLGRKDKYPQKYGDYVYTQRLNYINLPITFNMYLLDEKLNIHAGPQFGFCAGGNNIYKYSDDNNSRNSNKKMAKKDGDTKGDYNIFDMSIIAGANYFITENIFAGLRYQFSFTNSLNAFKVKTHSFESIGSKNQVISINMGWRF